MTVTQVSKKTLWKHVHEFAQLPEASVGSMREYSFVGGEKLLESGRAPAMGLFSAVQQQ